MRTSVILAGATVFLTAGSACAAATAATDSASGTASVPAAQTGSTSASAGGMSIRQEIQNQLAKDGYSNITIMPSSFMVRAKDKRGDPVEMVIGPDFATQVTEVLPTTAQGSAKGQAAASTASAAATPAPSASAQNPKPQP